MAKRYFAPKRSREPNLVTIILILAVLVGLLCAGARLVAWYRMGYRAAARHSAADDLKEAQARSDEGDRAGASELLGPIVEHVEDPGITPRALLLQARIDLEEGRREDALALLERAVQGYPDSQDFPVLVAQYARLLEDGGDVARALPWYESIRDSAPPGMRAAGLVGLGRQAERDGDMPAARSLYRQAVEDAGLASPGRDNGLWQEAAEALGKVNVALIFAPGATPESKYYTVEKGDTLTNIGLALNTTQGLLTRANRVDDPSRLHLGQRLKYTPKDFRIIIERSTCRLFLMDKEGLFKCYAVGLGMPGHETVLGTYTIGNKQKDPTWFKPRSDAVPPGDPRNELGTRWMPLVPTEEGLPTDLGIHGTIAPETVGQYKSRGCPRLVKEDVEELYDLVVRATPVEIVEEISWAKTG